MTAQADLTERARAAILEWDGKDESLVMVVAAFAQSEREAAYQQAMEAPFTKALVAEAREAAAAEARQAAIEECAQTSVEYISSPDLCGCSQGIADAILRLASPAPQEDK